MQGRAASLAAALERNDFRYAEQLAKELL